MNSLSKLRKSGIALMVGALALSGAVGVSVVANAAETGPATPTVPAQHIDTNQTGTIVIHKFANPATGTENGNGLEATPNTKPVAGVTFTYQKIKEINLTENEGWVKASKLRLTTEGALPDGYTAEDAADFPVTATDGSATMTGLPLGVYLIKEKTAPNSVVSQAKPFLVTVPFPNNDATTKAGKPWLYKVHVYPKNTVLTDDERPKKVVNNETDIHFPGDEISWTITQKIPQLETGKALESYVFTDVLPGTVNPITDADKDTKILVAVTGADAGKTPIKATPSKSVDGQTVKVEFTGDELAKLTAGATVTITLKTTIVDAPAGSIVNQSITNVNGKNFHSIPDGVTITPKNDPDLPENNDKIGDMATKVDFGDLNITKKNSDDALLQGAEFKIAPANAQGTCEDVKPLEDTSGAYKTAVASNDKGKATLKVKAGTYCVQESKAPLGYVLNEEVKKAVVTADTVGEVTIVDKKYNEDGNSLLPSLPVTGALGFVLLVLAGVMIIALAVGTGFVAVGRNKKRAE